MPTVYIGGQPFDSSLLGPDARRLVEESTDEEVRTNNEERSAEDDLARAKTADQIRLAELRLQRVQAQHQARMEQLERKAEEAERTETARRQTAEHQSQLRLQEEQQRLQLRAQARQQAETQREATRSRRETQRRQAANQRAAAQRAGRARHEVTGAHAGLTATSVLPESGEVRFLDALINIAVAAVTVIWTATRTASSALAWAVFWILLGSLMAVEGRGELRYGGFAVSAANASYLALRIAQIVKTNPSAGYVAANEVATAYAAADYATMARVGARFLNLGNSA